MIKFYLKRIKLKGYYTNASMSIPKDSVSCAIKIMVL